jgi:uncharacterized protein (TIGR02996 family)
MNTEQAFMQAVCEAPDDAAPRLVFADWLEDNGQAERAEFIRLQCRRAAMSEWDDYDSLVEREQELLKKHEKKWIKPAAKFTRRVEWRRGFVEEMALPAAKFLENAEAIFAATPLLTLRPLQIRPAWNDFIASEHLSRLRVLAMYFSSLGVERTRSLGSCERLANLHELNVGVNQARRGVEGILRSPHLGNLRRLKLNKNDSGDRLIEPLAEAKRFPHLRLLDLLGNGISAEGARQLCRIGWLSQLEQLNLAENPIGDAGVEALAASGVWSNHRRLDLRECKLTGASGRHLAACSHLSGLRDLHVGTKGGEGFVSDLARSPHLHGLRTLDLMQSDGLSEADADALVRSPMAANLRCLRLHALSRAVQKILLTAESLSGLTTLCLMGSRSSPSDGLVGKWIREATHLENLTSLDVSYNQLGNEGLTHLAESPHLARLTYLDVGSNGATKVGFEALANSPHLGRLRKLATGYLQGDQATRKMLEARFGEVVY